MRFSEYQIKEAFERSTLKLAVIALSIIALSFSLLLILDLSKEAIVVERACDTRLLELASSSQTKEEIQAFVEEAIKLRFDSKVLRDPTAFLIQDLFVARSKEQEELKRGGVDQRLIVRAVRATGDSFLVEADRIVAIGKARSAIPIVLSAQISSKGRSLSNPYGLILTSIEQMKEEKKND